MIDATQCNNHHMTERTHIPRRPCFDDDDDDNDITVLQSTQLCYPLPRFLATTLPEPYTKKIKKPYSPQPGRRISTLEGPLLENIMSLQPQLMIAEIERFNC